MVFLPTLVIRFDKDSLSTVVGLACLQGEKLLMNSPALAKI
jgi:hypothetical protein